MAKADAQCELKGLASRYFLPGTDVLGTYEKKTGPERVAYRNEVVQGRLMAVDIVFSEFLAALNQDAGGWNTGLDVAGIVTGGAGAIVSSSSAAKILSGLSGATSGASASLNRNVYYETTIPSLVATMFAGRSTIRAQILQGLASPDSSYSLAAGLSDVERYYLAGSVPGAVAEITKAAGAKAEKSELEIATLRTATFASSERRGRVEAVVEKIDKLPDGAAASILASPPVELAPDVRAALVARNAGRPLTAEQFKGRDAEAKQLLKMLAVLFDRADESQLAALEAAVTAAGSS